MDLPSGLEELFEVARRLPHSPGVYLMKDASGEVIYIGKAKDLQARVRSYFSGGDSRHNVQYLLQNVRQIETLASENERQALVLEADLVRKYKPRYNIRLKDDKAPLLVRIDHSHPWPRLELVRRVSNDGAQYIGPFPFSYELRAMLEVVRRILPLRSCTDRTLANRVRPCLEYQIKRCLAPCCKVVDSAKYAELLNQAVQVLEGKNEIVLDDVRQRMEQASQELRYEDAAEYRDRLKLLEQAQDERITVHFPGAASRDAFGFYREGESAEVTVLTVRRGRLAESKNFHFDEALMPNDELLSAVISQWYQSAAEIPQEVLLPIEIEDADERAALLSERRGSQVNLRVPQRGVMVRLLSLAMSNARENFQASSGTGAAIACQLLAKELALAQIPRVIHCADISHIQGRATVAAVVSFKDGKPFRREYRTFHLSQEGKPDDFASMAEVARRHLSRMAEENTMCDLLLVDGGLAQLAQWVTVRDELGLFEPTFISLAKSRRIKRGKGKDQREEYRPERVYTEESQNAVLLIPGSPALNLLEHLRDEAHRVAVGFHRSTRTRRDLTSKLDSVPGIGPKRRKLLLKEFGSIRAISQASAGEIAERCRFSLLLAERVLAGLQHGASEN